MSQKHFKKLKFQVNINSLSSESRIIREKEKQLDGDYWVRSSLRLHRTENVRSESRITQLAYGIFRGRKYKQIEPKTKKPLRPNQVKRIYNKLVLKDRTFIDFDVQKWIDE